MRRNVRVTSIPAVTRLASRSIRRQTENPTLFVSTIPSEITIDLAHYPRAILMGGSDSDSDILKDCNVISIKSHNTIPAGPRPILFRHKKPGDTHDLHA